MITAWMVIAIVPTAIVLGIGVAASHNQPVLRDAVIALAVVAFVAALAIGAVVRQTFAVALYRYATDHPAQGPFDQHDLRSPFKAKRGLFG
jgi:fructose-specific phosphotransferase system IIC component